MGISLSIKDETKINPSAVKRFEQLWLVEGEKLSRGELIAASLVDGEIYPIDYCISTIARLINQSCGLSLVNKIRNDLSNLYDVAKSQYIYPDESLHISLLGCTQRKSTNTFPSNYIHNMKAVCNQEIKQSDVAEIILKGIGIVGNQIFIQGFPVNRAWENLRTSLEEELINIGEEPISYKDKSPIHINIIKIIDINPEQLHSLQESISKLRNIELGNIKLQTIELVITDFCVTPKNVTFLDTIKI